MRRLPGRLFPAAAQGFLGLGQLCEYAPAMAEVIRAGWSDRDLARRAVQELHAETALEPAHVGAHHRARERELVGRPREGPEFRDPGEGLHRL